LKNIQEEMSFAQITNRRSLRGIEISLRAMRPKLYHGDFRSNIYRTTLAKANKNRHCRIYADFAHILINKAQGLYADDYLEFLTGREVYALNSTTIDLCLALFSWANFRKRKAAVKLHTPMSLKGSIPTFISITDSKVHDVNILDKLILEPGVIYLMDRAYVDYARLFTFTKTLSTFVTRAKTNLNYTRILSQPVKKETGLRSDQTIRLKGYYVSTDYPAALRRVSYFDKETKKKLVFLTNNFTLPALTIALLYNVTRRRLGRVTRILLESSHFFFEQPYFFT
jgi:hypothetical protein